MEKIGKLVREDAEPDKGGVSGQQVSEQVIRHEIKHSRQLISTGAQHNPCLRNTNESVCTPKKQSLLHPLGSPS